MRTFIPTSKDIFNNDLKELLFLFVFYFVISIVIWFYYQSIFTQAAIFTTTSSAFYFLRFIYRRLNVAKYQNLYSIVISSTNIQGPSFSLLSLERLNFELSDIETIKIGNPRYFSTTKIIFKNKESIKIHPAFSYEEQTQILDTLGIKEA